MPCLGHYPPRPNLLHLKHQAKDLLQAHQQGDAKAYARIGEFLPRYADADAAAIAGPFSLQEAQHVIACEYGFKHWEMLCTVIEANLDLLANLSNNEIQKLLREGEIHGFIKSIRSGGAVVSERFLSNMSERVRNFIAEEIEHTDDPPAEELEATRQNLLQVAAVLAARGEIQWPDQGSGAADSIEDPFICEALQLAVDGCEPALLRDMMETRLDYALLQRQKTRGQIVIEATMGLVSGDNPFIVRHKLSVFIAEPTPGWLHTN